MSIKELTHSTSSARPSSLISPCGNIGDTSSPDADYDSSSTDSKPSKHKSKFGALKSLRTGKSSKSHPLRKAFGSQSGRGGDGAEIRAQRRATYETPTYSTGSVSVSNSASMPSLATVTSTVDDTKEDTFTQSDSLSGNEKQQKFQASRALSTPAGRIAEAKRCNSLESFATSMVVNCCISGNFDTNGDMDNDCLPSDIDTKILGSSVEEGSEKAAALLVSGDEESVKGHLELLTDHDPMEDITDEETVKTDDIQFNLVDGANGGTPEAVVIETETSTEILLQQGLPPDAMNGLPDLHDIQVTINEHKLRLHMERNKQSEGDDDEEEEIEHCAINETVQQCTNPTCQVHSKAPFDRTLPSPRTEVFEPRPARSACECNSAQSVPSGNMTCMGCFSFIHAKTNTGNQAEPCIVKPALTNQPKASAGESHATATGECAQVARLGDKLWEAPDQR